MKPKAVLDIACRDRNACEQLVAVLTPDNEGGPRGLKTSLTRSGGVLHVQVEAETPATAVSTCLAFLRDAALFQEVWLLSQRKQG